jgi:hypothetical protein
VSRVRVCGGRQEGQEGALGTQTSRSMLLLLQLAGLGLGNVALAPCDNVSSVRPSASSQYWVSTPLRAADAAAADAQQQGQGGSITRAPPCSAIPKPCQNTPGHTYCESDPRAGQCQRPPVKTCPACPRGLSGGVLRNPFRSNAPWSKTGTCLKCADTSQVCQSNCQSDGDCGTTFNGTRRTCSPPGLGGLKCLPCNGPLTCAPGAALLSDWCGGEPLSPAHGTVGDAGQRWTFVPATSPTGAASTGAMQIKSILSAPLSSGAVADSRTELCVTADGSFSIIVAACEAAPQGNSTQLWVNRTGRLSPLSAPDRCIDRSYSGGDPSPPPPLPAFRNVSLGARARAADLVARLTLEGVCCCSDQLGSHYIYYIIIIFM